VKDNVQLLPLAALIVTPEKAATPEVFVVAVTGEASEHPEPLTDTEIVTSATASTTALSIN
jgi:hypothetical protein